MFVAWVYDCGDYLKKSGSTAYLKWLAALRCGSSKSAIPSGVSLDPEANRWDYDSPLTFRGGIIDTPMGQVSGRVSESIGGRRVPPRIR